MYLTPVVIGYLPHATDTSLFEVPMPRSSNLNSIVDVGRRFLFHPAA